MSQGKRKYREFLKSVDKRVPARSLRRHRNEERKGRAEEDIHMLEGDLILASSTWLSTFSILSWL